MEKEHFTHLVIVYGVLSYYNINTKSIKGASNINDFFIDICIWVEVMLNKDFCKVEILRELSEEDQYH